MSYSNEKNIQMLIALMKAHNIKRIVASPGSSNVPFVGSVQSDPFFEMYSSVDERSAAYIACGLAAETGEPVALSCTGATASRNYFPGLTEAYYRHLPVLAITASRHLGMIGQNLPQVIDRLDQPADTVKLSVQIPTINSADDEWACNVQLNRALLELRRHEGGPVHINLVTTFSREFSVRELPEFRVIKRFDINAELPAVPTGRTVVFVGNHKPWSDELTEAVDAFCEQYNGIVLCDNASNYRGKYGVSIGFTPKRALIVAGCANADLMIHIGDVTSSKSSITPEAVWRVHPDGEIRDPTRRVSAVFEMDELRFFQAYLKDGGAEKRLTYYQSCKELVDGLRGRIPALPFSSTWIASKTMPRLPEGCSLHLAILTSLVTWNKFDKKNSVSVFSNTGGYGIDGPLSTVLGASLANPDKLYFCVVGDLAFFYDMNALGNRHAGKNLRILLVNNGLGQTMRMQGSLGYLFDAETANQYISAAGHFGNKSPDLVRHYAEDLGYAYMTASTKEEYMAQIDRFVDPEIGDRSVIFEVFTDGEKENEALVLINKLGDTAAMNFAETTVKKLVGESGLQTVKNIVKKRSGYR